MPVFQRSIVDEAGNVMPLASVEVRDQVTSTLVQLYSDYDLATTIGNPITADADGFVRFYVAAGRYRIVATLGAVSRTWEDEVLGLDGALIEYRRTGAEISAGFVPTDKQYPEGDIRRAGIVFSGDETAAFQEIIDFCVASGVPIKGAVGTITVTSTITIEELTGDLSMVTVQANSASVDPVIRVGVTGAAPTVINGDLRLPKLVNSAYVGSGWATFGTGYDLAAVYQSTMLIPQVIGFDIGVDAGGYSSGFSYNVVTIPMLQNNKVGLRVGGKTSNTGWANQNVFFLNRCFISSSEGTDIAGARYVLLAPFATTDTSTTWPNGNTFMGITVESDQPEYLIEVAGINNLFINTRLETGTTSKVKITGHASSTLTQENFFIGGYNVSDIHFTTSGVVSSTGVLNPLKSVLIGSGCVLNLQNEGSGSNPVVQVFPAGTAQKTVLEATNTATAWCARLSSETLSGKLTGDTDPRVSLDFTTGYIRHVTYIETAANIASVGHAVNTAGKFVNKRVWDTTNNRELRASGSAAADPWYVVDGSATITPS